MSAIKRYAVATAANAQQLFYSSFALLNLNKILIDFYHIFFLFPYFFTLKTIIYIVKYVFLFQTFEFYLIYQAYEYVFLNRNKRNITHTTQVIKYEVW